MNCLLHERSQPPLHQVLETLLANAEAADLALRNIRLSAMDPAPHTVAHVRLRILLGTFEAAHVQEPATRARITRLARLLDSGRVEVRSAGIGSWAPDFSLYRMRAGNRVSMACLVGAHYWQTPPCSCGPSFTSVYTRKSVVATTARRFEELWHMGHDVGAVISDALARMKESTLA